MNKKMMPLVLTVLVLLGSGPLLAACHTMAGAGEDISNTGKALENSAEKHAP
jgi:predicted small secreted protein